MDLMKICRACNCEKLNLLNLFANDCEDEPTLGEKFLVCTSLYLQEADEYPQHICYSCAKQLETAYKFRRQCERSFTQLQKRLHNTKKVQQIENHIESNTVPPPTTIIKQIESIPFDEEVIAIEVDDELPNEEVLEIHSTTADIESLPEKLTVDQNQFKVEAICEEFSNEDFAEPNQHSEYDDGISESALFQMQLKSEVLSEAEEIFDLRHDQDVQEPPHKNIINVDIAIEERPYQCAECDKNFFTVRALELHMKLTHKCKQKRSRAEAQITVTDAMSPNASICSVCNRTLDSIDDLRMHRILEHGPMSFECNVCGQVVRDRVSYKKHLLSHKNSERFPCKICGKQYTDARYLYRHMLYHQVSVYKCEEPGCLKSFNVKHKYVDHIRLHHNKSLTTDEVRQIQPIEHLDNE